MSVAGFDGSFLSRGDVGYEAARHATVWNARTPLGALLPELYARFGKGRRA